MLKLYNTLTRKKENFKPISKEKVGFYSCGPAVYWYPHIGNLRTYIFSDLLKRILLYNGYKVKHIMNVTDVGHLVNDSDSGEDKMEKAAAKEGKSAQEIADYYWKIFREDFKKLNITEPSVLCKATEHIREQIEMIKKLEDNGYTYKTSDGIYFNTSKFKNYGKIANIQKEAIQAGKRVSVGEKKNSTDFALWKFSDKPGERQQEWISPWGLGYPGWHIECSAMSIKYLGQPFDIHTGGEDHRQLHHPNEIAQSEAASGKKFVNYWLHGAFLLFKGEKVNKSTGGLYTVTELEDLGYHPLHYRYLCLLTHYRKPLHFSLDNIDAAKNAYERLKRKVIELRNEERIGKDLSKEYEKRFHDAINDDINIPAGLQVFLKAIDDFDFDSKKKLLLLEHFDSVLGIGVADMQETAVLLPSEVQHLVDARERLRKNKLWAEADIIRERIKEKGYIVEDKPEGPKIDKI